MSDQAIVDLLRKNQTDRAFEKLYSYFPKVEKLILSKGGSKQDAQDIYQEALIVFCRKAQHPDFRLTSKIGTYLYSVSRFMWKDEQQKRKRTSSGLNTASLPADEQDLHEAVEQERNISLAEKALESLGEKCLQLLTRFYHRKERMKHIATEMGFTSEGAAKNQKYKCLESARLAFKKLTGNAIA